MYLELFLKSEDKATYIKSLDESSKMKLYEEAKEYGEKQRDEAIKLEAQKESTEKELNELNAKLVQLGFNSLEELSKGITSLEEEINNEMIECAKSLEEV